MFIYKPITLTYRGWFQMTILSNKKNKTINVNRRASKNAQIKSRQSVKKTNNPKNKAPSEELLDLTRTWDEDLCE